MEINTNKENFSSEKNQQDIIIVQKNPLPNLLIPKKTWNIIKEKSKSSKNIFNKNKYSQQINTPIRLRSNLDKKTFNVNNISENFSRTNGVGFNKFHYKIKNFKKYKNSNDNDYNKKTNYLINENYNYNYEKKDIEQILLLKIEEIKKELEKNENTFIYNQKK